MRSRVPDYVSYALVAAIAGPLILVIPFIGGFLLAPVGYLLEFYDLLVPGDYASTSGGHIEYGAFWVSILTMQGWCFIVSFFFIVGFVVGTLKHITAGNTGRFALSIFALFVVSLLSATVLHSYTYNSERIELTTATETIFSCEDNSALELRTDQTVWRFEESGPERSFSLMGQVDKDANTFTWQEFDFVKNDYTTTLLEQYQSDLSTCQNNQGATILSLYEERPSSITFRCVDTSRLVIEIDQSVYLYEDNADEPSVFMLGSINRSTGTFMWSEFGDVQNEVSTALLSKFKRHLSTCRNNAGDSLLDLFKELP